jgi:hypothetical protein
VSFIWLIAVICIFVWGHANNRHGVESYRLASAQAVINDCHGQPFNRANNFQAFSSRQILGMLEGLELIQAPGPGSRFAEVKLLRPSRKLLLQP